MEIKRGEIIEVEISAYAYGGKGIARIPTEAGDFVLFVPNTIPGQLVQARVTKKRKKHAECTLLKILQPSPDEVEIPYQAIPGAPYATLPEKLQQQYKKETALQLFHKIGGIPEPEKLLDTYITSPLTWHYRNKMEYSFSAIRYDLQKEDMVDEFGLGFKHRGTWWSNENLDKDSGLFDEEVENKLIELRHFFMSTGFSAWHYPNKQGFFRFLIVRKSYFDNSLLMELVTTSDFLAQFSDEAMIEKIQSLFGKRVVGIIHSTNDDVGDRARSSAGNGDVKLVYGKPNIIEEIVGLQFKISMKSFFQTNPSSAHLLYNKVVEYVTENLSNNKSVIMDLFCGTGTIGQIIAKKLPDTKIIGVDIVDDAISDAKENAKRNKINNTKFFVADVKRFLLDYPQYVNKIDTIIIDPPRAGLAPKALLKIVELGAQTIVYVSCNPATQARDMITLKENNYHLEKFSLVDQFPHTSHIESIALFKLMSHE